MTALLVVGSVYAVGLGWLAWEFWRAPLIEELEP
jgi:hypothetical protein